MASAELDTDNDQTPEKQKEKQLGLSASEIKRLSSGVEFIDLEELTEEETELPTLPGLASSLEDIEKELQEGAEPLVSTEEAELAADPPAETPLPELSPAVPSVALSANPAKNTTEALKPKAEKALTTAPALQTPKEKATEKKVEERSAEQAPPKTSTAAAPPKPAAEESIALSTKQLDALVEKLTPSPTVKKTTKAAAKRTAKKKVKKKTLKPEKVTLSKAISSKKPATSSRPAATSEAALAVNAAHQALFIYLDQLFSHLPKHLVEEFAHSKHYDTYAEILKQLKV